MDINSIELTIENVLNVWPTLPLEDKTKLFKRIGLECDKAFTAAIYPKIYSDFLPALQTKANELGADKLMKNIEGRIKNLQKRNKTEHEIQEIIINEFETKHRCTIEFNGPTSSCSVNGLKFLVKVKA